jgi:hypothetical protein
MVSGLSPILSDGEGPGLSYLRMPGDTNEGMTRRGTRRGEHASPPRDPFVGAQQAAGTVMAPIAGPIGDTAERLKEASPARAAHWVGQGLDMMVGEAPGASRAAAAGEPAYWEPGTGEPVPRRTRGGVTMTPDVGAPTAGGFDTAFLGADVATLGAPSMLRGAAGALRGAAQIPEDLAMAGVRSAPGIIDRVHTLPGQISTRRPGVRSPEFGELTDLTVSYDAAKRDLDALAHNVSLMEQIPTIQPNRRLRNPISRAENIIEQEKDNLLYLWERGGPEKQALNREWYVGANRLAQDTAQRYGTTTQQQAGVIAALSPQKDWNENVEIAERLTRLYKDPPAYSGAMDSALDRIKSNLGPKQRSLVDEIRGKEYARLQNNKQRAVWLRAADEASGDRTVRAVLPNGTRGDLLLKKDGQPRTVLWNKVNEIEKALNILDDGSTENIAANLGGAHKVRTFYNQIWKPESAREEAVMDTHATASATLMPLSGDSWPVQHVMGITPAGMPGPKTPALSGMSGVYPLQQEAFIRAAREAEAMPREMQSVMWEEARDLFPAAFKRHGQNAPEATGYGRLQQAYDLYHQGLLPRPDLLRLIEDIPAKYRIAP